MGTVNCCAYQRKNCKLISRITNWRDIFQIVALYSSVDCFFLIIFVCVDFLPEGMTNGFLIYLKYILQAGWKFEITSQWQTKKLVFNEKEIITLPFKKCTKFIHSMNFTPFLNHGFYIYNHSFVNCEHDLQYVLLLFKDMKLILSTQFCLEIWR